MTNLIQAAIFDMDGLLIDTEPLWKEAEIRVFGQLGIKLTHEMCHETEGFRLDEAVRYWYDRFPWKEVTLQEVENDISASLITLMLERGNAMAGVYETLDFFQKKGLKMGLASSSSIKIIEAVVDKLQIRHYFEVLWSAQFEEKGKPNPAVFLTTAAKLNVHPSTCMVFEDSYNGVLAAREAGMFTIAVPYPEQFHLPKFDIADLKLVSLNDFSENRLMILQDRIRMTE